MKFEEIIYGLRNAKEFPEHYEEVSELAIDLLERTRWIPVSERLPEIETEVIVFSGLLMWIAFLTKEKVWEIVGHDETYDQSLVTHWMPLPEPPKEAE